MMKKKKESAMWSTNAPNSLQTELMKSGSSLAERSTSSIAKPGLIETCVPFLHSWLYPCGIIGDACNEQLWLTHDKK